MSEDRCVMCGEIIPEGTQVCTSCREKVKTMDKRPRRKDGSIYQSCTECGIAPEQCKGFCIFQRMEKETEKNRRKEHGNRLQRHGRIE